MIRQGTSVPVAIPMAARMAAAPAAGPPDADAADGDPRAATFVPPHQLLQRMSGADRFSLGVSAGVRPGCKCVDAAQQPGSEPRQTALGCSVLNQVPRN